MDEHTFILLYKAMVRPHVEFANSVWYPFKLGDIKEIEKMQKRATKLLTLSLPIRSLRPDSLLTAHTCPVAATGSHNNWN